MSISPLEEVCFFFVISECCWDFSNWHNQRFLLPTSRAEGPAPPARASNTCSTQEQRQWRPGLTAEFWLPTSSISRGWIGSPLPSSCRSPTQVSCTEMEAPTRVLKGIRPQSGDPESLMRMPKQPAGRLWTQRGLPAGISETRWAPQSTHLSWSLLLHSGSQLLTGSGTKQAYLSARLGQTTPPYSILRRGAAFPEPNLDSSRDLIQAGRGAREAAHKTFSVIKRTPLSRGTYGLIIVGTTQLSPLERSWGSLTVQCYHLWASLNPGIHTHQHLVLSVTRPERLTRLQCSLARTNLKVSL